MVELKDSRLVMTPSEGHGRELILGCGVRDMCGRGRPGKTVGTQLTVGSTITGVGPGICRGRRAIVFIRGTIAEGLLYRHIGAMLASEGRVCDGT